MKWSSFGDGLWFWDVLGLSSCWDDLLGHRWNILKLSGVSMFWDILRPVVTSRDISWHVVKDGLSLTHMTYIWHIYDIYIWHHMTIMTPWPQRYSEVLGNGCCSTVNLTSWSTLLINPQFPKDLQQMEAYFFTENWAEMIFELAIRWLQTCLKFNIRCNSLGFELYIAVLFQISISWKVPSGFSLACETCGMALWWIALQCHWVPLSQWDGGWQFLSFGAEPIWIANIKFQLCTPYFHIFPSIIFFLSFFSFRCFVFGASSILTNPYWHLLSWTTGCDPDLWE